MVALDLINFRRKFKMSQLDAALALGCSVRAIRNWETGVTDIPEYIALAASAWAMNLPKWGTQ